MVTTHTRRPCSILSSRRWFLSTGIKAALFTIPLVGLGSEILAQDKSLSTRRKELQELFRQKNESIVAATPIVLVRGTFAPRLSEPFSYRINGEIVVLQLIEIGELAHNSVSQSALRKIEEPTFQAKIKEEGFTLLFRTSSELSLPQGTYKLTNDSLGEVELFLVPVERRQGPWRYYEAVFNRLQL